MIFNSGIDDGKPGDLQIYKGVTLKISDYKLRKFDPDSRDEIITTVEFSHYGFKCKGKR